MAGRERERIRRGILHQYKDSLLIGGLHQRKEGTRCKKGTYRTILLISRRKEGLCIGRVRGEEVKGKGGERGEKGKKGEGNGKQRERKNRYLVATSSALECMYDYF